MTSFRPTCESVGRNYEGAFTKQLFRKTSLPVLLSLTEGYLLATSRHVPAGQNDVTLRGQAAKQHLACKTGGTFFAFSGDHEANVERETRTTGAGLALAWEREKRACFAG